MSITVATSCRCLGIGYMTLKGKESGEWYVDHSHKRLMVVKNSYF